MEKKKNTQSYTIYCRALAFKLVEEGFELQGTAPNTHFGDKEVYYFKNSPALQYRIKQYIEQSK